MASSGRHVILLSFLVWLHVIGIYYFCKGFLLTRTEIHTLAHCNDTHGAPIHQHCYHLPKPPRKVILFIIDALRIDFAALSFGPARHYRNQLSFLHQSGAAAHLFLGRADPPTTTSQRLKAITTGGLPAFIEAGRNFDSDRILEDNLIFQLKQHNKSVVVLGDDTWVSLYDPSLFLRSSPFPSFDVWDLDTVDNGILKTLYDEVPRSDHQLLIAHFLGVDHAGHRYHADHPRMSQKLQQMNEVLLKVYDLMDPDDILIVMGDHGMTAEGDHGGGTEDEVAAALYVRGKRSLTGPEWELSRLFGQPGLRKGTTYNQTDGRQVTVVAQVDLVPSLALLLDLPIPFSNLGQLIPELLLLPFITSLLDVRAAFMSVLEALRTNARQVHHYLHTYEAAVDAFPDDELAAMDSQFYQAEECASDVLQHTNSTVEDIEKVYTQYVQYLHAVAHSVRQLWTTFDLTSMVYGIGFLACTALVSVTLSLGSGKCWALGHGHWMALGSAFIFSGICVPLSLLSAVVFIAKQCGNLTVSSIWTLAWWSSIDLLVLVLICMRLAGVFSNSWIVAEDAAVFHFLVASAGLLLTRGLASTGSRASHLWMAFAILIGMGRFGMTTVVRRTLGTHVIDMSALFDMPLPVAAAALLGLWVTFAALHAGYGVLRSRMLLYVYVPVCSLCCVMYWAHSNVHGQGTGHQETAYAAAWARGVYLLSVLALPLPLLKSSPGVTGDFCWVHCLSHFCIVLLYPLILVTGIRYVHVFLFHLWQYCALVVLGRGLQTPVQKDKGVPQGTLLLTFSCTLLSSHLFFCTGHQNVFNLINFNSGFVGVLQYNIWVCGFLTLLNTFGGHLWATLMCPIVIHMAQRGHQLADSTHTSDDYMGCTAVARRAIVCFTALIWLSTVCSAVCALIMRRHLMVWAIFTPKWCFDGLQSLLVAGTTVGLAILLTLLMKPDVTTPNNS